MASRGLSIFALFSVVLGCRSEPTGNEGQTFSTTNSSTSSTSSDSDDPATETETSGPPADLGTEEGEGVEILSFEADSSEVELGQQVDLAWTTQGASVCVFFGGDEAWQMGNPELPAGSKAVTVDFEGPLVFGLRCVGQGPEDLAEAELEITGVPGEQPLDCSMQDVALGTDYTWEQTFFAPFPDKQQFNQDINVPGDQYFSVAFNTADFLGNLSISTTALQGGVRSVSLSRCPGHFVTNTPIECLDQHGIGDVLQASTNPMFEGCVLEPDTDYFINVSYVDFIEPINEPSSCDGACTVRFTVGVN